MPRSPPRTNRAHVSNDGWIKVRQPRQARQARQPSEAQVVDAEVLNEIVDVKRTPAPRHVEEATARRVRPPVDGVQVTPESMFDWAMAGDFRKLLRHLFIAFLRRASPETLVGVDRMVFVHVNRAIAEDPSLSAGLFSGLEDMFAAKCLGFRRWPKDLVRELMQPAQVTMLPASRVASAADLDEIVALNGSQCSMNSVVAFLCGNTDTTTLARRKLVALAVQRAFKLVVYFVASCSTLEGERFQEVVHNALSWLPCLHRDLSRMMLCVLDTVDTRGTRAEALAAKMCLVEHPVSMQWTGPPSQFPDDYLFDETSIANALVRGDAARSALRDAIATGNHRLVQAVMGRQPESERPKGQAVELLWKTVMTASKSGMGDPTWRPKVVRYLYNPNPHDETASDRKKFYTAEYMAWTDTVKFIVNWLTPDNQQDLYEAILQLRLEQN